MNSYIVVLGTNSIDEYYEMDTVPVMGEKVVCNHIADKVGGMLANAAAVFAGYSLKTYMIDFLNTGKSAQMIVEDMANCNVDASYCTRDDSLPESKCLVMLKDGERVIFVIPNHKKNLRLTVEQQELVKDAACVYTTLSELHAFDDTQRLVSAICESHARLALDIEPNTLREFHADWEILSKADIIFVNNGGNQRLHDLYGDYAGPLLSGGCVIMRTMGRDGCAIYAGGQETVRIPGHAVPVIDTTGAGDTFNASFIYGVERGWPLEKCGEFANAAAARAIGIFGPRGGIATEKQVWDFLKHKIQQEE